MKEETQVSEINIVPIKPNEGLIAFASFVLDQKYYVGSVAVYTRLNGGGFRLAYPTRKVGEKNINIFYPINVDTGRKIEEAVSEKVSRLFSENYHESTQ